MNDLELLEWCRCQADEEPCIQFPEPLLEEMTQQQAELIARHIGATTLMRLPAREIKFFEWLKIQDRKVWDDLWKTEDEAPYIVGVSFLPLIINKTRGFPICDLLYNDNYYFSEFHIVDEESKVMLDTARERFLANENLSLEQLLTLEISIAPIDIWRFAYNHKIPLFEAKAAVAALVEDKALVHLKEAEHLAHFIDF